MPLQRVESVLCLGSGAKALGGPRAPCPQGAPRVGLAGRQGASQPPRLNSGGPSHRLPPWGHCPGRLLTGGRHVDLRVGDGASPLLCILGPECGPAATTPRAPRLATCPALSADSSSATVPARLLGPPGTPRAGAPQRPVRGEGGDGGLACGCRRACRMKPEGG